MLPKMMMRRIKNKKMRWDVCWRRGLDERRIRLTLLKLSDQLTLWQKIHQNILTSDHHHHLHHHLYDLLQLFWGEARKEFSAPHLQVSGHFSLKIYLPILSDDDSMFTFLYIKPTGDNTMSWMDKKENERDLSQHRKLLLSPTWKWLWKFLVIIRREGIPKRKSRSSLFLYSSHWRLSCLKLCLTHNTTQHTHTHTPVVLWELDRFWSSRFFIPSLILFFLFESSPSSSSSWLPATCIRLSAKNGWLHHLVSWHHDIMCCSQVFTLILLEESAAVA